MPLRGRDFYLARVKKFLGDFPTAVSAAMGQEALNIQARSQELCPVEHGTLRRSATTTPVGTFDNPRWRIAYGTDYAMYVHERLDLHHPVGQAKFLEQAINESKPTYVQNLWRRTSANLKATGQ